MQSFLERLLPTQGLYCTARATKEELGEIEAIPYFLHEWHETVAEAIAYIEKMDALGHTMYLAQSSFSSEKVRAAEAHNKTLPRTLTKEERKAQKHKLRAQVNVVFARSFWFDIDCGEEKFAANPNNCYRTQQDAADDLKRFIAESGLPFPAVVSSGNGLYAHWLLDADVHSASWDGIARLLKQTAAAYKFKVDPTRTADSASVLRPPGSHNRKRGEEKPVLLIKDMAAIQLAHFSAKLGEAAKAKKVDISTLKPAKVDDSLNSAFLRGTEGRPSSAFKIAERCGMLRYVKDTKGNVPEPIWYAGIGVLRHTIEAPDVIHEWSCGHPDYTPAATDDKIAQHTLPPTTCAYFGDQDPQPCVGCVHKGHVKSPISLGYDEVQSEAMSSPEDLPDEAPLELPAGYVWSPENGGVCYVEDTSHIAVYPYEIYPIRIAHDDFLGHEVVTWRHRTPHNGWETVDIRSSLVHDPKSLLMAFHDKHVQVTGGRERKLFVSFAEDWIKKLRSQERRAQLHSQMGWRESEDGLCFVLGDQVLRSDGTAETTGLSRNVPEVMREFRTQGSAAAWSEMTSVLGGRGFEPHAFTLLAGAFGAPLMRFTGYPGALLSLVGKSGRGKTLVGRWALSAYGRSDKLMMQRDDTYNSLIGRLALYGTLPLYLDEVSNIDGSDLSDMVYRITQGRDKARLNKNSLERPNLNCWNTLAISSSNHSLIDKLGGLKSDASAEISRIFELTIPGSFELDKPTAHKIYRTLDENYGGVGAEYVRYLAMNSAKHRANLDRIIEDIDTRAHTATEERFWSAILAVATYGGLIAQKLGLIKFDVEWVRDWAIETVQGMRVIKGDAVVSQFALLGMILDKHAGNCIGVTDTDGKLGCSVVREPRGPIYYRFEMDKKRLFVSKAWLRKQVNEHFGSMVELKAELLGTAVAPALVDQDRRISLAKGTQFSTISQPTWEIDLSVPELGHMVMQIVRAVNEDPVRAALTPVSRVSQ